MSDTASDREVSFTQVCHFLHNILWLQTHYVIAEEAQHVDDPPSIFSSNLEIPSNILKENQLAGVEGLLKKKSDVSIVYLKKF